jgi:hypothetical protein
MRIATFVEQTHTFSEIAYTVACKCAPIIMGMILASTILRFEVP